MEETDGVGEPAPAASFSKEQEEGGEEEGGGRICPDRQGRSSFSLTKIWAIHEGRFCLPFQNRMSLKAH